MGWPQWVWIVLIAIDLLGTAHLHGTPRGPYNFWWVSLDTVVIVFLLYMGGFFG